MIQFGIECRSVSQVIIIFTWSVVMIIGCGKQTIRQNNFTYSQGGIIRADSTKKKIALIFTGGDYADGGEHIADVLKKRDIQAGFFFTGDFYRDPDKVELIRRLIDDGHYLGPHSDQHLLYCAWVNRDSLLVTKQEFISDIVANYAVMEELSIPPAKVHYFIPPFEWYNDTIIAWSKEQGWILINNTPGTLSQADYTIPSMENYRSSDVIWDNILDYEQNAAHGLNGFLLLIHIGTHPERTDKFYHKLDPLIEYLQKQGYQFQRFDNLL
ncbi:MAG: polysaccharide deacetylase family protein [Candidatus Marinimicrobia bacterium]|nr:polysaccharide deacetylase family protein [Candidatus Neomarinimicrobiota bacterium]